MYDFAEKPNQRGKSFLNKEAVLLETYDKKKKQREAAAAAAAAGGSPSSANPSADEIDGIRTLCLCVCVCVVDQFILSTCAATRKDECV